MSAATADQKKQAVEIETKLKHQALHDTMVTNEALQREIAQLHKQVDETNRNIDTCRKDIEEAKKRHTIQRFHRQKFEEQKRQHVLKELVSGGGGGRGHRADNNDLEAVKHAASMAVAAETEKELFPNGRPVSIEELRVVAQDTIQRCRAAEHERDRIKGILKELSEYKHKLEKAVRRQVELNEHLGQDLHEMKDRVAKAAGKARDETQVVRKAEKDLQAAKSRKDRLASTSKELQKLSSRLEKKKDLYEKEIAQMHSGRKETQERILKEVRLSEDREAMILQLRGENQKMLDWLMDDADVHLTSSEDEDDDDDNNDDTTEKKTTKKKSKSANARLLDEAHAKDLLRAKQIKILEQELRSRSASKQRDNEEESKRKEKEQRLFGELDAVLEKTKRAVSSSAAADHH